MLKDATEFLYEPGHYLLIKSLSTDEVSYAQFYLQLNKFLFKVSMVFLTSIF